jgi:hypothetical protein
VSPDGLLEAQLLHAGDHAEAALIGLRGISIRQIALELTYLTWQRQPDCSDFWVPALSRDAIRKAHCNFGLLLRMPSIDNLVWQRLSLDSAGRWLFILDNVANGDMLLQPQADA